MSLGDLVIRLSADVAEFRNDMGKAVASVNTSAAQIENRVNTLGNNIKSSIKGMAGGLAAAFTVAGFESLIKSTIQAQAHLADLAKQTGATVESLSALKRLAGMTGTDFESVTSAMGKLAKNLAGVDDESKGAGKALAAIGLSLAEIERKSPDQQLKAIADAMGNYADGAGKAAVAQAIFGKTGAQLLPFFDDLAQAQSLVGKVTTENAEAAEKLTKSWNALGNSANALGMAIANDAVPLLQILVDQFKEVKKAGVDAASSAADFSATRETLKALIVVGSEVAFVFRGVGTEIGGIAAQFAALGRGDFKAFAAIREAMVADAEAARQAQDKFTASVMAVGTAAEVVAKKVSAAKPSLDGIKLTKDAAESAKKSIDDLAVALNKIYSKDSGVDASYWKDIETLNAGYKAGRLSLEQYADAVGKLTMQQKFYTDEVAAATKAADEMRAALAKNRDEAANAAQSIEDQAKALERQVENYGLLQSAIYDKLAADAEEARVLAMKEQDSDEVVRSLDRQIAAYRRLAAAQRGIEAKDAAKQAAEDAAKAWEKFSDDIERSLTDALMRGFEAGKGFGEAFVDSLRNTLKTAALKIAVQAIVNPVMGTVSQALGVGSTGVNALSTGMNLANGGTLFGAGSAAVNSTLYSTLGSMGTEQAAMLAAQDAAFGLEGAAATLEAAGANTASAALAAAPYIAAALAIVSMLDSPGGGPKTEGRSVYDPITNQQLDPGAYGFDRYTGAKAITDTLAMGLGEAIQSVVTKLGGDASKYAASFYVGRDPAGTAQSNVTANVMRDGQTIYTGGGEKYGRSDAELQAGITEQTNRALLAALKAADLTPWAEDILASLDPLTAGADQVAAALAQLDGLAQVAGMFEVVGVSASELSVGLVESMGGFDSAAAALSGYYEAIYSEQDKLAKSTSAVADVFEQAGVAIPQTAEEFRALVDGLDLTTDAGRQAFAQLTAVAPLWKQTNEAATKAAQDAAKAWAGFDAAGLGKMLLDAAFNPQAGMTAAEAFAAALNDSVRNALINSTVGNVADMIYQSIIVPMVAGQAVAQGAIDEVVTYAQTALDSLGQVLAKLDLSAITAAAGDFANGLGRYAPAPAPAAPTYSAPAAAVEPFGSAADILAQKLQIQAEIFKLTGDAAGAAAVLEQQRAAELEKLAPELRALQTELWGLQDAAEATAAAAAEAKRIADERAGLEGRLNQALGDSAAIRERELAAVDASNRGILTMIYAIEDTNKAVDAAMAAVRRAADAERDRIEADRDAQLSALESSATHWQKVVRDADAAAKAVERMVETLADGARSLRGGIDAGGTLAAARAFIDQAINSRSVSDPEALQRAVRAVQTDSVANYATRQDYEFAQRVQAGKLDDLAGILGDQLDDQRDMLDVANLQLTAIESQRDAINTLADSQLAAIDQQVADAQNQVDALRGIDNSVVSVRDAINALGAALAASRQVTAAANPGATIADAYGRYLNRAPEAAGLDYWKGQVAGGASISDVVNQIANSAEGKVNSLYSEILGRTPDSSGLSYWMDQLNAGVSISTITDAIKQSDEYRALRGYASGTSFVPSDMVANIHQGEIIIDPQSAGILRRYGIGLNVGGDPELVAEVRALRAELRAQQGAIAANTRQSKDLLDSVINGGNTLRTEVIV